MNARNMTDAELVHAVDCDGQASEREKELAARFAEAYPYAHGDAAAEQLEALADRVEGVLEALADRVTGVEASRKLLEELACDLQTAAEGGLLALKSSV